MKCTPRWTPLLAIAAALLLAGCASTPERRAEASPGVLDGIDSAEHERVMDGRIAVGDTPEIVRIAWGNPDRKTRVVRESGEAERWVYHGYEREFVDTFPRYHFRPRYYYHPGLGRYIMTRHHYFAHPQTFVVRRPYARQVVEFRDGLVAAFETDER
ncbi:MAG: hypothetical protein JJU00_04020 [Opitutales bacterium]|nr:hypothetical protein [Opitutales bacterium]